MLLVLEVLGARLAGGAVSAGDLMPGFHVFALGGGSCLLMGCGRTPKNTFFLSFFLRKTWG